jgi:hypothetical protein
MPEEDLMKGVLLSPEGVEERLVEQRKYQICLTQGGKFRVYYGERRDDGKECRHTVGIFDDIKEARKRLGFIMNMNGAMIVRPDETIQMILKNLLDE